MRELPVVKEIEPTHQAFKKILHLGTTKIGNRYARVFITIQWDGRCLHFTGVEGPLASGNTLGSCGQISRPTITTYAPGWTARAINRVFAIWKAYHLNDMQAGCEHQQALGWSNYADHPSEPCPTCRYKFGTAWLRKDVPDNILWELRQYPNADKQSAWMWM